MSRPRRTAVLLLACLAAGPAAALQTPGPSGATPSGTHTAAPQPAPEPTPRSFTVYFPEQDEKERRAAAQAAKAPRPAPPPESAAGVLTLLALLVVGVLAWKRFRAPLCPRCRTKMVTLEPAEGEADPPGIEVLACPGCNEVARRKRHLFFVRDARCPDCGAPTRVFRPVTLDKPGYLTWGRLRIDDECASCAHRAAREYAVPPLEAPARARPRSRTT